MTTQSAPHGVAGRIPELDGLRGVAILMVLTYHYFENTMVTRPGTLLAHLQTAMGLSWSGVDLFFVLSGFLIGGILLDARASTNYFRVFYTRRFFRIIPIYVVVLLVFPALLSVTRWTGHSNDFAWLAMGRNSLPWWSYWTFTQNFWMAHTERFGAMTLAITWSLAIEEQFYLTLPFLVRLLTGPQLRKCVRLGIYAAPIIRIGIGLHFHHNWMALFALMPCRADSLLLGVLAAMLMRDAQWRERIQRSNRFAVLIPVLLLGMVALTVWAHSVDNPIMQSLGYTWLALFYVSVLLCALTQTGSVLSRVLRTKWLGWLGGLAYGVYLFHQTIQGVLFGLIWHCEPVITGGYTLLTTLSALILTLVIAQRSWKHFELPLVAGHRAVYQFAPREEQVIPSEPWVFFKRV
jgi:peptidoglycan/LPS O-acetylase OafA/YrhL